MASKPELTIAPVITGCWQFAGGHGYQALENVEGKLRLHAEAGLTTFDTADIYGPSEEILGAFQSAWRAEGKPSVQVLTKYVPNIFNQKVTPRAVEAAIQRSLLKLKVSSLDLVQLHWWDYGIPGMLDAALALTDLKARGLIAHVGTTNMNVRAIEQLLDAGVPIISNQVQFSLLDRRPLNGMLQLCAARGVKLLAYGALAGGLLSDKHVEQPKPGLFGQEKWSNVELNTSSLKMYWGTVKRFGGQAPWRRLLLTLRGIADKHGVSISNVALRWLMQQGGAGGARESGMQGAHDTQGGIVVPMVGIGAAHHIEDNIRAVAFTLDSKDLEAIEVVLGQSAPPSGDIYSVERGE